METFCDPTFKNHRFQKLFFINLFVEDITMEVKVKLIYFSMK